MTVAVSFRQVSKRYKEKDAVKDLSFTIEQGSVVSLLGPNGAGKTTSISMMLGLRRPSSGEVRVFGADPRVPTNRTHMGAMLQQADLPMNMTVAEVVNMFRSYYPHPLPTDTLLALADLSNEKKKTASKLSGGQKRRLQFALAMAGNPRLLFLDEPTTAMDVTSRRTFWDELRSFAAENGRTIVLTTHHLEEADAISDRILLLQHGRLIADGTPSELKRSAGNRYVSFVAGSGFSMSRLHAMSGVESVEQSGRHIKVRTKDSDSLLRQIISNNFDVSDFEVTSGALEDAFVTLTESSSKEAM